MNSLLTAAQVSNLMRIQNLLKNDVDDENVKLQKLSRSLYVNAMSGDLDMVKVLIVAGADVNVHENIVGFTPLYWSAIKGHTDIVKALIAAGADVNANKENGRTPLYWSAREGHTAIAKALIEAGADVDGNKKNERTPLHWSAREGHADIVKILIEAGADVEVEMDKGPLYWSAKNGHANIVKLLIAAGAGICMGTSHKNEKKRVLNKYTLLCQHSLNWRLILENDLMVLNQIWDECEEQVKEMKETCMGGSRTSFFDFITEKDKNKLAFYASEETFGLKNELERISCVKRFSIYAKDIETLFHEGRKRAILLLKCQESMMHCFCYTLPLDIVRKISEYMSNYDIENFLVLNNILM